MTHRMVQLLTIAAATALLGCAHYAPPPPSCRPVAHVTALYGGNFAYVEHQGRSVPATFGQPICYGDQFRTGPGTKLEIALESGGTVTLDVNTDPNFFQTAECLVISIFTGKMAVNKNDVCVQSGANKTHQHSFVLYEAVPNSSSLAITVIAGQVDTISPRGYSINAGQMMVLRGGRAVAPPASVNPAVLARMQSWLPVVTP